MSPIQNLFLIFLILLLVALLFWLFSIYLEIKKLFGRVAAQRNLRRLIAVALGLLVYFSVGFTIFSFSLRFGIAGIYFTVSAFGLPFELHLVGSALTWHKRKRRAGAVLLDLGRYSEVGNVGIILGGLITLYAINFGVSAFSNLSKDSDIGLGLSLLIYAIMCGGIGIFHILISLSHIEIRDRGICHPFFVIRWEVIAAYRWIESERNILCIFYQTKWSPFQLLKVKVPLAHKSRVEQLLSQRLPLEANLT